MQLSNEIAELAKALSAVGVELKNPKNASDNPFFNSKYAELPDILNLVRPILASHGLSLVQSPVTDENNNPGISSLLIHDSGQYILFDPFFMRPSKTDPQAAGGAITYARRYSLNAILALCGEDEDDDGNGASHGEPYNITPISHPVLCPVCGKTVKPVKGKDGAVSTQEQVLEKLGMCTTCYKKEIEAAKAADQMNAAGMQEGMTI